jgi:protein ImuB
MSTNWFAVIFLPQLQLQAALRLREEKWRESIAIVEGETTKGRVLELTDTAAQAGVRKGMASSQAMARCSGLQLWHRSLSQEEIMSALLIETAGMFSPLIEATAPDICLLDLQWLKATDWEKWARDIAAQCANVRLRANIGVAPNPDVALLAAKRAKQTLIVNDSAKFLSKIAISELNASSELIAILREWGINHLGELARLPRTEVVERLGKEGGQLWDRASGRGQRPLRLVRLVEIFAETFEFECPIETTEPLLFILRRMLDQLIVRLRQSYRVAAKMILRLQLESGAPYERSFLIPSPTLEGEVLFRILHTHLEDLILAHRPAGLRFEIEPSKPQGRQFQFFENQLRDLNGFSETLARLQAVVGLENVGVIELADTHQPNSFRLVEPAFEKLSPTRNARKSNDRALGLPLRRFRPSFSAQVHLTHCVPNWVFSEKAYGEIVDVAGPYRVSGGWWDRETWTAEEWDIELDCGALYRLSKQKDSWFVEGCYDTPLR